jgi:hypothetical protein
LKWKRIRELSAAKNDTTEFEMTAGCELAENDGYKEMNFLKGRRVINLEKNQEEVEGNHDMENGVEPNDDGLHRKVLR